MNHIIQMNCGFDQPIDLWRDGMRRQHKAPQAARTAITVRLPQLEALAKMPVRSFQKIAPPVSQVLSVTAQNARLERSSRSREARPVTHAQPMLKALPEAPHAHARRDLMDQMVVLACVLRVHS